MTRGTRGDKGGQGYHTTLTTLSTQMLRIFLQVILNICLEESISFEEVGEKWLKEDVDAVTVCFAVLSSFAASRCVHVRVYVST